jgi:chromosome segregation ATPase
MPRGITQDQVNAAADAILSAGENPTVEKVRAELGTGSPNTVTRMLDVWRNQLGERLRQLSALPDLPTPVGQAMMGLWQLATDHASRAIAGRFAEERTALEVARDALATERQEWTARLEAAETDQARAQAAKDLAEHACATLDAQLQDSHALRADLIQQRDRLQGICDSQIEELRQLRRQLDEKDVALHEERARQDTYVRAIEDRAHQEIDRARQEAKLCHQRLDALEKSQLAALTELELQRNSARDQLRVADKDIARQAGQIATLEKALAEAHPRAPKKQASQRRRQKPVTSEPAAKRGRRKKASPDPRSGD